ncbi:hypothetical protein [Vreelandella aquamarina]|uniref:Lipoprotein n=1 Tax=Vreelandella aquamarina TaxID=77097 RepID=A0A857GGS7_9GAMM|nr:hypothetical protein [Halomonas meridiana]QHD48488.1 hypothetical protein CTT34_01630 [Halomonas meridiana]
MKKILIMAGLLIGLSGCAQQEVMQQTQSGFAEKTIQDKSQSVVSQDIINACINRGHTIRESSDSRVVCSSTMQGANAALTQMLIGNSYSTTPEVVVSFVIASIGENVRVVAQPHVETQMAMGQNQVQSMRDNNALRNNLQMFLNSL